jgi:hypothetical protein
MICKGNLVVSTAQGSNFEEFKSGGQHEKHAVTTWNLRTISVFRF